MDNPYLECDLGELAQACSERADALHARAWHSESERNALREATAQLLAAVARQLATFPLVDDGVVALLSPADLREFIDTRVIHMPLQAGGTHAWTDDFVAGG